MTNTTALKALLAKVEDVELDVESHMLHSMATSLRYQIPFSFNHEDMADLLDRVAAERIISRSLIAEGEGQ